MKVKKLVHVSVENGKTAQSNKYYNMTENADGTFTAEYGRVGCSKPSIEKYPMFRWDEKYHEKTVKKNYKDVTDLFQENIVENKSVRQTIHDIKIPSIKLLFDDLRRFANKSIEENYKVTQDSVTQLQIDEAQGIINKINTTLKSNSINLQYVNSLLMDLYMIIPRKMKDVRENVFKSLSTKDDLKKSELKMKEEQDTLDTMSGQVELIKQQKLSNIDNVENNTEIDLLESMGLQVNEASNTEIEMIKKMMGPNARQLKKAFKIINNKTEERFKKVVSVAKNKKTEMFWHGSRNQNFFNIIQTGLLIRPSGATYTGSMFGDGIYGADKAQKSIGYSSLSGSYWAGGNSNKAYLALFDFHVGNQKHITYHNSDCYTLNKNKLEREGFDSVYAHGGADLRNNEFIVYDSNQVTIKYLIEIQ